MPSEIRGSTASWWTPTTLVDIGAALHTRRHLGHGGFRVVHGGGIGLGAAHTNIPLQYAPPRRTIVATVVNSAIHKPCFEDLVSDPELRQARLEVDRSLLRWSKSLSPMDRLRACSNATRALDRFRRVPPEAS